MFLNIALFLITGVNVFGVLTPGGPPTWLSALAAVACAFVLGLRVGSDSY